MILGIIYGIIFYSIAAFIIYKLLSKIYRFLSKKKVTQQELHTNIEEKKPMEEMINIPDTCPHCKNPNSKKIRLCEWCGN
jgi:hypothetical protein